MEAETIGVVDQCDASGPTLVPASGPAGVTGVAHEMRTIPQAQERPRALFDESGPGKTAPRVLGNVPPVVNDTGQWPAAVVRRELRLALVSLQQALEAKDGALESKDRVITTLERLIEAQEQHLESMSRHRDAAQGQADELRRRVDDLLSANSQLSLRLSMPWWKHMFRRTS